MKVTFEGKSYDAVALLMALHRNTAPLGMGEFADAMRNGAPLTFEEASAILEQRKALGPGMHPFTFDYVHGRPLKVRADANGEISAHSRVLYDRDAGQGAFDRVLAEVAAQGDGNA